MAFPDLVPSSRQYGSGDFPVGKYRAVNGMEVRVLRGSKRTGMTLKLSYNAITDAEAELFLQHYQEQKGSFDAFDITASTLSGYGGTSNSLTADANEWRYDAPIDIQNVCPGVSNVSVSLAGVLKN